MRPWRRALLALAVILGGSTVYFITRLAIVNGVFAGTAEISPGVCRVIGAGLRGPHDMDVDAAHNALLVSSGQGQGSDPRDGIYWLKLDAPGAPPAKVETGLKDFHPRGIALYRAPDGSEILYAVNRRAGGQQTIELFALTYQNGMPKLVQQTSIESGLLVSPHDVAAAGSSRFYVANDHGTKGAFGRFAEDRLLLPLADLLSFNGQALATAVTRIASARGVLATPEGHYLYVAASGDRRLLAFRREPFLGTLTEIGSLALPARPDHISMDAGGDLIVAGEARPASALVFRVARDKDGTLTGYQTIFSDDGRRLAGASSAVLWNHHLFVGSSRDDKMLDCAVK